MYLAVSVKIEFLQVASNCFTVPDGLFPNVLACNIVLYHTSGSPQNSAKLNNRGRPRTSVTPPPSLSAYCSNYTYHLCLVSFISILRQSRTSANDSKGICLLPFAASAKPLPLSYATRYSTLANFPTITSIYLPDSPPQPNATTCHVCGLSYSLLTLSIPDNHRAASTFRVAATLTKPLFFTVCISLGSSLPLDLCHTLDVAAMSLPTITSVP